MDIYLLGLAGLVAVATVAVGARLRVFAAASWLAIAIAGQAVALELVDAGKAVHYQHLRSIVSLLSGNSALLVFLVGVQAVAVAVGLYRKREILNRAWSPGTAVLKAWQWAAVVIVVVLASATLSREPLAWVEELVAATFLTSVNLGTIVMFALTLPDGLVRSGRAWLSQTLGEKTGKESNTAEGHRIIDRFALGGAAWVFIVCSLLAVFVYQRHPHVPDEVSYIYHARYFAAGELAMPAPPVEGAFDLDLLTYEPDRWYSPVPPGWPAILSIGVLLGAPWLVNPLLAGLNVVLAWRLVQRLYGNRAARIASLLLCVSPWHLFMGMSFMPHTLTLTCFLLAALCVERMRRTGSVWFGIPGGAAVGFASLIRPLDGLMIAVAMGLWSLGARGRRLRWAPAAALTLATIAVGSTQLAYNARLTGGATVFPINQYADRLYGEGVNSLGFGANRGIGWGLDPFPGHGLRDVLVNADLNVTAMSVELFGWSIGSLALASALLFTGRFRRTEYWLFAFIGLVVGAQSLYWFSGGPDFGARYWFLLLMPLIVLTVLGMERLADRIDLACSGESAAGTRVFFAVGALAMAALVTFVPWRSADKYYHYRNMQPGIRALLATAPWDESVVFVRGDRHPDYASAAVYNPLNLEDGSPVFVWDRDPRVRKDVLAAYGQRSVWFVDGPTVTGGEYEIVGGPMDAEAALTFSPPARRAVAADHSGD